MLQDAIDPMIIQNVENSVDFLEDKFISEGNVILQQDDCSEKSIKDVRNYLDL